ncbi:ABC transporter permease [Levilactobacillus namurensis]|uniref:Permease n=1 Tax=Levilactobacillus namurensis TaxID=380393 RepID=A0AAW8W462_9LACO|nr:permease [Levilactobacillus namurensis]MDT7013523.1 permease [Levilactobacillus namurensis]
MTTTTHLGLLTRIAFKRDRARLLIWLLVLVGLMTAVAVKFNDLYGTPAEITAIMGTLKSPAIVAMFGAYPASGTPTTAEVFANEMLVFMAIMQIIMNLGLAVHATRGEEDSGLTELVRAHAVGPQVPVLATLIELAVVNLASGMLYALGLNLAGMSGATATGNWLIGLGLAAIGWLFGTLALVTAQLADHAASATGTAYVLFGLSYLVRMLTDVQDPRLTWWSPLGWIEKLTPYHHPNALPLGLMLLTGVVLANSALAIASRRDIGAGVLATRPGRRTASAVLRGPWTLLWRRHYRVLLGWLLGIAILGAAYGTVFNTIGDILKTNTTLQQVFGPAMVHAANHRLLVNFTALLTVILSAVAIIPGLQLVLSLYTDETTGWLEGLYARSVSRSYLLFSYLGTALIASTLIYGISLGSLILTGNASLTHTADGLTTFEFWQGFWGQLPVIWLFLALGAFAVGGWPRGRVLLWGYLALGFISQYLGGLLDLPQWVHRFTPFGWMPTVPEHTVDWHVFGTLSVLALVSVLVGWWRYTRRDLQLR